MTRAPLPDEDKATISARHIVDWSTKPPPWDRLGPLIADAIRQDVVRIMSNPQTNQHVPPLKNRESKWVLGGSSVSTATTRRS